MNLIVAKEDMGGGIMLIRRIISSIVLAIILLATIFLFPRPVVALVVALLIGLGLWEFYVISETKGFNPFKIFGVCMGVLLSVVTYIIISYSHTIDIDKAISFILFFVLFIVMIKYSLKKDGAGVIANSAITMLGILYISFLFTFIIKLRYIPNAQEGKGWVMGLFIIPKFSDISAYLFGTKFGRHKLIPRISAKKTIEGAVAGIIGAVLISLLLRFWFLRGISWFSIVVLGILLSVVGQVGDLIESLIKRDAKVKDSGKLVPGIGGVLDLMDSLLFAGPVLYLFLILSEA